MRGKRILVVEDDPDLGELLLHVCAQPDTLSILPVPCLKPSADFLSTATNLSCRIVTGPHEVVRVEC